MRLTFVSPSGKGHGHKELDVDLTTVEHYRTLIRFSGLPLSEPGRHIFRVELQEDPERGWQPVAAVPLITNFVERLPGEAELNKDQQT